MKNPLAEVEQQPFKDQNGTSAAEDGERLASQQTEDPTSDRRAQKTLQHALHVRAETLVRWVKKPLPGKHNRERLEPDLHVFCSVSQQAPESDGIRHRAQVNKQYGRQGLDMKRIGEVTEEERRFSFDVK